MMECDTNGWKKTGSIMGLKKLKLLEKFCPTSGEIMWEIQIEISQKTTLGLGTDGGYLYDPSIAVKDVIVNAKWIFQMVGTVQAVLGPILLFLVLLTLRNRFKIK